MRGGAGGPIRSGMFVSRVVTLRSPLGPLALGIVDPMAPGVAEGISTLLVRSIQDAREANDGHLPGWLVDDIERNYISPAKIRSLWAETGHRFVVALGDEIVGTIHVAKQHDLILPIDRMRVNVPAADFPNVQPADFHHVVNISVRHELRRAKIGTAMVDGIVTSFRDTFEGEGLWVRADPPWHPSLAGLGFVHDPSMDVFLPEEVARTAGLPHPIFNQRYACDCPAPPERTRLMETKKLQYVSMARRFDAARADAVTVPARLEADATLAAREAVATDFGAVHRSLPRAVAVPESDDALAALLSRSDRRVTVRGAGQSTEGQSLGDDLVISTAGLDRVVAIEDGAVVVQAGVTWRKLLETLADDLPPVVPGWTNATIGGAIATCGFGKGSHRDGTIADHVLSMLVVTGDGRRIRCSRTQAGWLFDAVLGGFGLFGVVAEATLRLVPRRRCVTLTRTPLPTLDALSTTPAFHTMAFRTGEGFTAVRVDESDTGTPLKDYLLGRADAPPAPRAMLQIFSPRAQLAAVTDVVVAGVGDDAVVVHPVRRGRAGALVPTVAAEGEVFCAISVLGPPRDSHAAIAAEVTRLGARTTLFGALPEVAGSFLPERRDALARAKAMADPHRVLGAPRLRVLV